MPIKYLTPTLDKWVDEANALDTNNTTTTLTVLEDNASAKTTIALLTFDIAGEIPAGAVVIDASLRFWWDTFVGDTAVGFKIMKVTTPWDGLTNWNTRPTRSGIVTSFRESTLGIDDDVSTIIGYDYIRDTANKDEFGADDPDALVDLVQKWYTGATVNNGISIEWYKTTPGVDTTYILHSSNAVAEYHKPLLIVEYADGDTLPGTYSDEREGFYGAALDSLQRELVPKPDMHLYIEFADGTEVDLIEDWIGASGLGRKIPFLFDNLELQAASFSLDNEDGKYSDTNRESIFYFGALDGASIRAIVEIDGQQKVLYRGEIVTTRDGSNNTSEILCQSYFNRYLGIELLTVRDKSQYGDVFDGAPPSEISGRFPTLIYSAFHNYAGLPDVDINLNRFAELNATYLTLGFQIWDRVKVSDAARDMCNASRINPYIDGSGRLAAHQWVPDDPATTDEVASDSFEWYERRDKIVNQVDVDWTFPYPVETEIEPGGEKVTYTDQVSAEDPSIGLRNKSISTTAIRRSGSATQLGFALTQALGYPFKQGDLKGGAEFLRYDLGSVFWLRNDSKGIYSKVRVVEYDPRPGLNSAWSISMTVIPTNWTIPYRNAIIPVVEPVVTVSNDIAAPTPDSIAFRAEYNGEVTVTVGWTYEASLIAQDGFRVYVNHGPAPGQPLPTRDAASSYIYVNTQSGVREYEFRMPGSHYATIGVVAYALKGHGKVLESAITGSAAAPDWVDANALGDFLTGFVPTNVPTNLTAATTAETDVGTATVKLTWQYIQGANIADLFLIIGNFGDAPPAAPVYGSEDWSMLLPAGARDWTLELPKKNKIGTFEIAAVKETTEGLAFTAWQDDANWTDIQPSADAYDLDDITDGPTYGRILLTSTDGGGNVDLGGAGIVGDLDDIDDGAVYEKVKATSLDGAGDVDLGAAGIVGDLDDIPDGAVHAKVLTTDVTAGRVDVVADAVTPATGTLTKTLVIPFAALIPSTDTIVWQTPAAGYLAPNSAGVRANFIGGVVLPVGVTITEFYFRSYRAALGDLAQMIFYRQSDTGVATSIGSVVNTVTGWQTRSVLALGEVTAGQPYAMTVSLTGAAAIDARFVWAKFVYTMPDFGKAI